jgi:N-carbamoyl-L-amino-acid hydrolase
MSTRKDALQSATHLVQSVIAIANDHSPEGRGTVGTIRVRPGSRNVVPGRVEFTVDLRHPDSGILDGMVRAWHAACDDVMRRFGVGVRATEVQRFPSTPFHPDLVSTVEAAAQHRGQPYMRLVTGAGHDAVHIATIAPTAMIFVPCKDGVSHNEAEDADPAHLEAGCNVLLDVILERAGIA